MIGVHRPAWAQRAGMRYARGRYYPLLNGPVLVSAAVVAADRLMLHPAEIFAPVTIDRLFLRVVTGTADGMAKMGLWRADEEGRPTGAPVAVVNEAQATPAAGAVEAAVSPVRLEPGLYYAGSKFTGSLPTCTSVHGSTTSAVWLTGASTAAFAIAGGATNQTAGLYLADVFANDMPDLTSAAFTDITGANQGMPMLGFRVAP